MATNKSKRSIHLAQPQPQHPRRSASHEPAALTPVKSHVYQAIAELNAGLEKAIQNLQALQGNNLFRASGLAEMNHALRGIHARTSWQITAALSQRETANHRAGS
ncbi:MAG TPA: hypothetical protein VGR76_16150 [Candidatus Angelobacter sp.]|nr:hypothetical protein [Candidatus Angelobacter sp.]